MITIPVNEICSRIERRETFDATPPDESFFIHIQDYPPFACLAVHNGHRLRSDLKGKCILTERERWYEEDPETGSFIRSFPIVLIANDSRYEYDLNRAPDFCIYTEAWRKKIWNSALSDEERSVSLAKHAAFYKVVHTLIRTLESLYRACIVYDVHSYNYKRIHGPSPVFNIGTVQIDTALHRISIDRMKKELSAIEIPNVETTVDENRIFSGAGYLAWFVNQNSQSTLMLPLEIKKVYCDESSGELYPLVIDALQSGLKNAIVNTASFFIRKHRVIELKKKYHLLGRNLDKSIINVDRQIFSIAKDFEILNFINPINIEQEKKRFFKSRCTVDPSFKYRQLVINPYEFKRRLYQIPLETIDDIDIQTIYRDIISAYSDKIEMISSIGTGRFMYSSLRYFGEPDDTDIANANYLLHCPQTNGDDDTESLSAEEVRDYFYSLSGQYGFECKIEISRKTVSKVLVLNSKKTVLIRKDAYFSERSLKALAEHELGVHMLTTINSRLQKLNFLRLGLPVNTLTQEGLAILSEYLSGYMTVHRLKQLALRVKATRYMLSGYSFRRSYQLLAETGLITPDTAFYMTARVYRGGGFTKDYLYLRGFREVLKLYRERPQSIPSLLIGKTSLPYLSTIEQMIERTLLYRPEFVTHSFTETGSPDPIMEYIVSGIR